jgi:hypothetical protein
MVNAGFMRWINPDATADVICLGCFQTIARAQSRAELLAAEDLHTCTPLEHYIPSQPDPYHGLYG